MAHFRHKTDRGAYSSMEMPGRSCAVSMGSSQPQIEGTCSLYRADVGGVSWICDVGQEFPCSGKAMDDKCNFKGLEGVCTAKFASTRLYCNIWPVSDTLATESPTSAPTSAPSEVLNDVWCSKEAAGASCSILIDSAQKAKQGTCSLFQAHAGSGYWMCDIGQEAPCSGKAADDSCSFEDKDGVCTSKYASIRLYCNIWPIRKCERWCGGDSNPWSTKCTWKKCKGCDECRQDKEPQGCHSWCAKDSNPWSAKCTWKNCKKCGECSTLQASVCEEWCASDSNPWSAKCTWKKCRRCKECSNKVVRRAPAPAVQLQSLSEEYSVSKAKARAFGMACFLYLFLDGSTLFS